MPAPTVRIRSRFRSINAHDEQNRLKLRWYFAKIQEPTVVLTANGEVYTNEEAQVYTHDLNLLMTMQLLQETPAVLSLGKSAKTTDIPMSGSAVKSHGWPKTGRQFHAKRTTSFLMLFQGYPPVLVAIRRQHRHCRICLKQVQPKREVTGLPHEGGADHHQKPKTKKRGMAIEMRTTVCEIFLSGWRSSQIIQRTQNCMHPHTFLRTQIRNVLRKWYQNQNQGSTVFTLEVCLRTKRTRTPCRRRTGEAPPWAEKFGDFVTADHKVVNEKGESQNNHRYAVVVQDLAKQRLHKRRSRRKNRKLLLRTTLEFGKSCDDLSWNHRTSTPHRSETSGIAERAVRPVMKELRVLLQSELERYCYLRNVQELLADGKTPYERRFGEPFKAPIIPFGAMVEYHPISTREVSRLHQFGKKVLPGIFLGTHWPRREFGKEISW